MKNSTKCILTALSVIAVAVTGSIFTYIGQQWYGTLDKPSQWPPNYLFPIVWSVIYLLTFVTLCNIANKNEGQKAVFVTAAVNGVLNVVWCLTFFTLRQIFPALAERRSQRSFPFCPAWAYSPFRCRQPCCPRRPWEPRAFPFWI